jgi:hypothetical protein
MNDTTFVVIAIVAALALLGVVAVTIVTIPLQLQQAEARGCFFNPGGGGISGINASKGRCVHP